MGITWEQIKKEKLKYTIEFMAFFYAAYHFWIAFSGVRAIWQHRSLHILAAVMLAFVLKPYKANKDSSPAVKNLFLFINLALIFIALAVLLFAITNHTQIYFRMGRPILVDHIAMICTVVLIILATQRLLGWPMAIIAIAFIGYMLYGEHLPGIIGHQGYSIKRMTDQMFISTNGIFGPAIGVASTDIILFVIFAGFLEASGAGEFVTDLALAIAGRSRGGPAKTAVIASGFLGMMVGSPVANVAGTGAVTIPLMKRLGYDPNFAGAVEAAASSGGMIMPPVMGASVFLMAEFTGVPYLQICVYAALPAVLYYAAVFIMVHLESLKRDIPTLTQEQCPKLGPTFKKGWHYLLSIVFLVYLLSLGYSPMRCAFFATLSMIVLSWINKESRMGIKSIYKCFVFSGKSAVSVSAACGAAGIVAGVINMTGAGLKISSAIITFSGGSVLLALIFSMLASLVLGMGVVAVSAYLIVAALSAPALVKMGIMPVAAHLFLYYYGMMSNVTPPVALAAFTAAGIADGDAMKTGIIATKLASVGAIIPFMFVYNHELMLMGDDVGKIVWSATSALIGVFFLSFGFEGYCQCRLKWYECLLFVVAALCTIDPGLFTDVIGVVLAAVAFGSQWQRKKKLTAAAV